MRNAKNFDLEFLRGEKVMPIFDVEKCPLSRGNGVIQQWARTILIGLQGF